MTIPTLISNTNDVQYKSALKKIYSVLSQAQLLISTDNSGTYSAATSSCGGIGATPSTCLKDVWKGYLKYSKECAGGAAYGSGNCFPLGTTIKYLNGTVQTTDNFLDGPIRAGLILNDGICLTFYNWAGDCSATYTDTTYANKFCGAITVDVNGFKSPNQWGKDIYSFFIYSDRILPLSPAELGTADDCISTGYGYSCSYKYLTSGS